MNRFVPCEERTQDTFLPSRLEDYVTDDNPVRVIDVFVGELDLTKATGRPGYGIVTLTWDGRAGALRCSRARIRSRVGRTSPDARHQMPRT